MNRFRSLQLRLALRLAVIYLVATAIAFGVLIYRAYDTADTLNDRELSLRAQDLARHVSLDASGKMRLDLPRELAAAYGGSGGADAFAVRERDGRVIAASPVGFGERIAPWPAPTDDPGYFRISGLGAGSPDYYGLSLAVDSPAGPLSVSVARAAGAADLVRSLLREFVVDIAWTIPILVVLTLAIGVLAIRSGLEPIRSVSRLAAEIGPSATGIRLPQEGIPSEIEPLVTAVNSAFDRLEQGFAVQRQFTANAAHELRTPLAIITAALDAMDGDGDVVKLRSDVARMNRLVEQLLRVARLDAVALDTAGIVDLQAVAAEIVATMAPWAVAQGKSLALAGAAASVRVAGSNHAIRDALRNLIENAIAHSPAGGEVIVSVGRGGELSVSDHGPGVAVADRERVFDRFWRGKGAQTPGAGLGLAIVKEVVRAHRASIAIAENPGGGAVFTICFVPAN